LKSIGGAAGVTQKQAVDLATRLFGVTKLKQCDEYRKYTSSQVLGMVKQAAAQIAAHQEDIKRGISAFESTISTAVQKVLPVVEGIVDFISSHKTLVIFAITGIGTAVATIKMAA
jgi:hypothetical protein